MGSKGTLVVEFRRSSASATLVIVDDDGESFTDLFACDLTFISFRGVTRFVERSPGTLGSAFALLSDDVVSLSTVQEVSLEEPDNDEAIAVDRTRDLPVSFDDDTTLVMTRWDADLDATIVSPPAGNVLASLRLEAPA